MRMVRSWTVLLKVRASPWNSPRMVCGTISLAVCSMKSVAVPMGTPGTRLKEIVTLVNWLR